MSKLTDFYTQKALLQEEGKPIDPQWGLLEDQQDVRGQSLGTSNMFDTVGLHCIFGNSFGNHM